MEKRIRIEEFLDYGGDELFSTLMSNDTERSDGIERLVELLQSYSDSCRRIKGRSAAYRFMLRKAQRNDWIGSGAKDLKSHRLTREERERITEKLDQYISAGGRNSRIARKLFKILLIIIAVAVFVFAMARYIIQLEKYQNMSGGMTLAAADYNI